MTQKSIFIDVDKCNGCYNCFLSCRDEYYDNDYPGYSAPQPLNGQFWMQLLEVERGRFPRPKLSYIPVPCQQCKNAPCIAAARDGAVYRREDGIVMIDPVKAKGQKDIANACPYRVIFYNETLDLPQKCTLCAHRLDEGEKEPRCVEACPTGALLFGDVDDPTSDIAKAIKEKSATPFHPEYDTQPAVLYNAVPKKFVAGEVVLADQEDECAKGVKITLKGPGGTVTTESDEFGDFEFEGLEKNTTYTVVIEQPGYGTKKIEVVTQTDVQLGEVVLDPA